MKEERKQMKDKGEREGLTLENKEENYVEYNVK